MLVFNSSTCNGFLRILAIRAVSSPKVSRGTLGKNQGGNVPKKVVPGKAVVVQTFWAARRKPSRQVHAKSLPVLELGQVSHVEINMGYVKQVWQR